MATNTHSTPEISKRIVYNHTTQMYDCFISVDGGADQPIGSSPDYSAAEQQCRDYACNYYVDTNTPEKAVQIALNDLPTAGEDIDWLAIETPLATLTNGVTVLGDYDGEGLPLSAFFATADGLVVAGPDGDLYGEWAGVELAILPEALPRLRELFLGTTLPALQAIAGRWASNGSTALPACRPVHLNITMGIMAHLERNRARYGLAQPAINDLTVAIAALVDRELGIVASVTLPALKQVCTRREAGAPPMPQRHPAAERGERVAI